MKMTKVLKPQTWQIMMMIVSSRSKMILIETDRDEFQDFIAHAEMHQSNKDQKDTTIASDDSDDDGTRVGNNTNDQAEEPGTSLHTS